MLTRGNFKRDEWNNLLYLSDIRHFSSLLCCSQNFSLTSCTETTAKMMQEQEGGNRILANSKPTTKNLAVSVSTSSSTVKSPIASKSPRILKSTSSNRLVKFRETWREKCQTRRSVEFSRLAKRWSTGTIYSETCRDRRRPGTPELSWSFCT